MPKRLRIATFNLESLDDRPDLEPPLAARSAVLRPQLLRLKADVLCLQEVNGQRPTGGGPRRLLALDRLLAGTPYADFHRASSSRVSGPDSDQERGVDAVHNLVVLSRYPIVAREARLFIERLFDDDAEALIAVCGDFNAEERQTPLRTIRGDPSDTGNPELAARTLVPLERTLPASQRFSVVHGGHKEMLDHVLVSRALFARYDHVEVYNEALADELTDAGPESHHAPLVAEFELPQE